jgi:hypothetical protein
MFKFIKFIAVFSLILIFINFPSSGKIQPTPGVTRIVTPAPVAHTPTPHPAATSAPAAVYARIMQINVQMKGPIDINNGYYIFAFSRPRPGRSVADPISLGSDYWSDYISLGPNQISNFVRRERITPGDITTYWNIAVFSFNSGSYSDNNIQIILPLGDIGNPQDLYFNMITTDINGIPRDAIGAGTGSVLDSVHINLTQVNRTQVFTDRLNDVVTDPKPPDSFIPVSSSYDIVSGQIILQ